MRLPISGMLLAGALALAAAGPEDPGYPRPTSRVVVFADAGRAALVSLQAWPLVEAIRR